MGDRKLEVHLSWFYVGGMILGSLPSLFVATIIMWWVARYRFPWIIDEEGITKRSGVRVLWKDLTKIERVTVEKRGQRISGSLNLHFGDQIVQVNPVSFAEGFDVLDFCRAVSGRNLDIG